MDVGLAPRRLPDRCSRVTEEKFVADDKPQRRFSSIDFCVTKIIHVHFTTTSPNESETEAQEARIHLYIAYLYELDTCPTSHILTPTLYYEFENKTFSFQFNLHRSEGEEEQ
jgi:hypothetical protein